MSDAPWALAPLLSILAPAILMSQTLAPLPVRPQTCHASDTLLAPNTDRPRANITATRGASAGQLLLTRGGTIPKSGPVKAFMVSALYDANVPSPSPELSFQLAVADYRDRSGVATALVLTLDDTVRLELGEMHGQPNLAIGIPPAAARQLARARSITGVLGQTVFLMDEAGRDVIHAVYLAAVCGVRPR
jgi:hypothetical protein